MNSSLSVGFYEYYELRVTWVSKYFHSFIFPLWIYQDLRKKEKENRKLQQELKSEKDKFDQMVSKYVKEVQDLHASIYEESQWKNKLQMELDTKVSAPILSTGTTFTNDWNLTLSDRAFIKQPKQSLLE